MCLIDERGGLIARETRLTGFEMPSGENPPLIIRVITGWAAVRAGFDNQSGDSPPSFTRMPT
jgi:hypothetical protein